MDKMLRNKKSIFLLSSPGLFFLTLFLVVPLFISIGMSFFETNLLSKYEFVGFDNYVRLFADSEFWKATWRSWYLCVLSVVCDSLLGLVVALVMSLLGKRAQRFFRMTFLVPMVISISIISQMWVFIFDPSFGLINRLLELVGLDSLTHLWLTEKSTALFCVAFVGMWQCFGMSVLMMYAGLKAIPEQYLEAARIDGANFFQLCCHVTVPLMAEVIKTNIIMLSISGFFTFAQIKVMTNGGPGTRTMPLMMYIYKACFNYQEFGLGTAMATLSMIQAFAIILVINRFIARERIEL